MHDYKNERVGASYTCEGVDLKNHHDHGVLRHCSMRRSSSLCGL
jgi:hypothetical protein